MGSSRGDRLSRARGGHGELLTRNAAFHGRRGTTKRYGLPSKILFRTGTSLGEVQGEKTTLALLPIIRNVLSTVAILGPNAGL
jgi:hypothetical protein